MPTTQSKFLRASWTDALAHVPVFRPFGDVDDALRLTVLLADRLGPEMPNAREEMVACKTRKMPWEQRLDALQRLLDRTSPPSGRPYLGAIVDLDALHPGPPKGARIWKDRGFFAQRAAFFKAVIDAVERGGWLVLRPNPRRDVTADCGPASVPGESSTEAAAPELEGVSRALGADYRRVVRWLLEEKKAIDVEDALEVLEEQGPDGFESYALMLAYELLKPSVQRAGQRLSALRGPQSVNGMIGGFHVIPRTPPLEGGVSAAEVFGSVDEVPAVDHDAVAALEGCGFLLPVEPSLGRAALQMPSPIRAFLRRLARLEEPYRWTSDNRALVGTSIDALPIAEQLEAHHHAIEGGDLEQAGRTALYYGADLRGLAFRKSQEKELDEAAGVYQTIVDDFDSEDDYAWEYLGYNLARAIERRIKKGGAPATAKERERILKAYGNAASKARANPLYDGRLLGFRAEIGEPVSPEFNTRMQSYRDTSRWRRTAMGYFAKAVLDGLVRGGRRGERDELFRRWRSELQGNLHFREAT